LGEKSSSALEKLGSVVGAILQGYHLRDRWTGRNRRSSRLRGRHIHDPQLYISELNDVSGADRLAADDGLAIEMSSIR
jgi:hypothetical protein